MKQGVAFNTQAFTQPALGLEFSGLLLQVIMLTGARPLICSSRLRIGQKALFVLRRVAHVVNHQHNNAIDSIFTHPLRSDQFGYHGSDSSRYDRLAGLTASEEPARYKRKVGFSVVR